MARREHQRIGGPCGNPGDSPGFARILPHGSVLDLSVASYSVKASSQLTKTEPALGEGGVCVTEPVGPAGVRGGCTNLPS